MKSGFAERKGKSLIPTKDGCNLVCVLPEQITSPAMTEMCIRDRRHFVGIELNPEYTELAYKRIGGEI